MRLPTPQDLIFVELDHAAVVAQLAQQRRQLFGELLVRGGEIMKPLEVGCGAFAIAENTPPEIGAPPQQASHQRAVEHLVERGIERLFDAMGLLGSAAERLQCVEAVVVDMRDDRVLQPFERGLGLVQIFAGDLGGTPQHRTACAPAIAGTAPAAGESFGEGAQ